jgi:hypothetical protein
MSKMKLATYDEPMAMAIKACQWHEENDGPPVTHKDALVHVGMADPLRMGEAVTAMRKLVAVDGEFHHLTEQRKYLETAARAAELGVGSGRSVAKPLERKIKAVEDVSKRIALMPHLSPEMVGHLNELSSTIVTGAARTQNAERTIDLLEWQKELAAKLSMVMLEATKNAEKNEVKISQLESEVQFLRDIVRRFGGAAPGAVVAA